MVFLALKVSKEEVDILVCLVKRASLDFLVEKETPEILVSQVIKFSFIISYKQYINFLVKYSVNKNIDSLLSMRC